MTKKYCSFILALLLMLVSSTVCFATSANIETETVPIDEVVEQIEETTEADSTENVDINETPVVDVLLESDAIKIMDDFLYVKHVSNAVIDKDFFINIGFSNEELSNLVLDSVNGEINTGLNYNLFISKIYNIMAPDVFVQEFSSIFLNVENVLVIKEVGGEEIGIGNVIIDTVDSYQGSYSYLVHSNVDNGQIMECIFGIDKVNGVYVVSGIYDYKIVDKPTTVVDSNEGDIGSSETIKMGTVKLVVNVGENRPYGFDEYDFFVELYPESVSSVDATNNFYDIRAARGYVATYDLPYGEYSVVRGGVKGDTKNKFAIVSDIETFTIDENTKEITITFNFQNMNFITGEESEYTPPIVSQEKEDNSSIIKVIGILMILVSVIIIFCLFFLYSMKRYKNQ